MIIATTTTTLMDDDYKAVEQDTLYICYTSQQRRAPLINPSTRKRRRCTLGKLCHCCAKEGAVIRGNVNSLSQWRTPIHLTTTIQHGHPVRPDLHILISVRYCDAQVNGTLSISTDRESVNGLFASYSSSKNSEFWV